MITTHKIIFVDSRDLSRLPSSSIDLVVTSPPYPMIEMWDGLFSGMSASIRTALDQTEGNTAFDLMHGELDKVWAEVRRLLCNGGIACVNIGDATRTIGGEFRLFPNHSRIIAAFRSLGFSCLPLVLWRKQTNAPNKFMGSGMLPAGAYVTLEHEYILIFRKGPKREFASKVEMARRSGSAFFWEERNGWFSDLWDFKGCKQALTRSALRSRSAAFPFELAYRLICMYSLYGDTVLDPFAGTGTTMQAAMACGRNSIGVEIDKAFLPLLKEQIHAALALAETIIAGRVKEHLDFIRTRREGGNLPKYLNKPHGFPVITRQETELKLCRPGKIVETEKCTFSVEYAPLGSGVDPSAPGISAGCSGQELPVDLRP